jgi:tripartite-type tricarboxylate transporter receptor subunit TctC
MQQWPKVIAVLAGLTLVSVVHAQGQGSRPLRVIVPVAPGGPSDTAVRLIAPRLSDALGRPLVVDNRPSNNGVAGTEIAAKAVPDGNTLAIGNSGTQAINASLYRNLPYDPLRDFVPITQIVTSGMIVAANPRIPGTSLADLVAAAKKQPGGLNVGVAGSTGEIAGDALWAQTQLRMNNVRYKGSSPTELALIQGEVDIALLTPLASAPHIASGRMKAFGITSSQRSPVLPNVPTVAELGVPGYDFQIWHGFFAPRGTPERVIRTVHEQTVKVLQAPEVRERFTALGFVVVGSSPEEFAVQVRREVEMFRKVIAESGIKVE